MDMDLLEMRFYLNGEDLGPAFEDFSAYELHPAFSLNVRQCVRINFGQYKFLHPPNEVDGKPFKPVVAALLAKYQHQHLPVVPTHSAESPKATISPRKGNIIATPAFSATRNDDSPTHPAQAATATTSGDNSTRQQLQQQMIMNRMQRPASSSLTGRQRNISSASASRQTNGLTDSNTALQSAINEIVASGVNDSSAREALRPVESESSREVLGIAAQGRSANNEDSILLTEPPIVRVLDNESEGGNLEDSGAFSSVSIRQIIRILIK